VVKEQGDLANSFATTVRAHPNDAVFRHLNVNAPGSGSVISLKFKFAALLSDHSTLTLEAKLLLSLLLARILLHEVPHAIYNYRVPRAIEILGRGGTLEPFYEDQTYAEIGRAMEHCLFRGYTTIAYDWMNFETPSGLSAGKCPQRGSSLLTRMPKGAVPFVRKPSHSR
jgi:hypothetical protein